MKFIQNVLYVLNVVKRGVLASLIRFRFYLLSAGYLALTTSGLFLNSSSIFSFIVELLGAVYLIAEGFIEVNHLFTGSDENFLTIRDCYEIVENLDESLAEVLSNIIYAVQVKIDTIKNEQREFENTNIIEVNEMVTVKDENEEMKIQDDNTNLEVKDEKLQHQVEETPISFEHTPTNLNNNSNDTLILKYRPRK